LAAYNVRCWADDGDDGTALPVNTRLGRDWDLQHLCHL